MCIRDSHTIVSNESAEIIRMFNTAFDALGAKAGDYYPPALQPKIDELNGWIYAVSYTHLDVYKRQVIARVQAVENGFRQQVFFVLLAQQLR